MTYLRSIDALVILKSSHIEKFIENTLSLKSHQIVEVVQLSMRSSEIIDLSQMVPKVCMCYIGIYNSNYMLHHEDDDTITIDESLHSYEQRKGKIVIYGKFKVDDQLRCQKYVLDVSYKDPVTKCNELKFQIEHYSIGAQDFIILDENNLIRKDNDNY